MIVHVVITGRGYDGSEAVPEQLTLAAGASIDDALAAIATYLPPGRPLAASCLLSVSGQHVGTVGSHVPRTLDEGDELLVIAPVAGG